MSYVDEPTVQKALHSALSVIDQGGYDGTRKVVQISILVGALLTLLSALEDADDFVQPINDFMASKKVRFRVTTIS